ncbi:hypothetical protein TH53_20100 [Pedobacter lusitanus]|uniref:Right handed beta helix domain-containing protein n=1 Tax=Pedobacter lusitanus TaxID=1503925 RepID=A0A0D0GM84_9SPHI|nr:DNRLRE domain-containing protein [Pedobacter lusitanus]KIO75551.1 hypothetical protein TH53_20100 [Pedobacter lusitanus]
MKNLNHPVILLVLLMMVSCKKSAIKLEAQTKTTTSVTGTVYYVDPNGDDNNDGKSTAQAWKTIDKVNTIIFNPGDQILFKSGGIWNGQLKPKGSGIQNSNIIMNKYDTGNKPQINGPGSNGSSAISLNNQSYWEINNFDITNTGTETNASVRGIYVSQADSVRGSDIKILNCDIHDVKSAPGTSAASNKSSGGIILAGNTDNVLVQKNTVKNSTLEGIRTLGAPGKSTNVVFDQNYLENILGDGIVLSNVINSAVTRNTFKNCAYSTTSLNYAVCWTINSVGTRVAFNEVFNTKGGGSNDGQSFDADLTTDGDIFEYNYSHDNKRAFMLFMNSSKNIIVRYNLSINDAQTPGYGLFLYISTSTTNKIYNNTFYIKGNLDYIFKSGAFNSIFNNNIIYAEGTVSKFGDKPLSTSSVIQNNCFYPASIIAVNGPQGTVSGNIYVNPDFVNVSAPALVESFKLQKSSALISAGFNMTNNGGLDYFQTPLPVSNPDIGAAQSIYSFTGFVSNADTYVKNGSYATTNYGTETGIFVKSDVPSYARKSYVKFDFSSINSSAISNARLVLNASGVNTDPSRVIKVYTTSANSWLETSLTWNNAPANGTLVNSFTVYKAEKYAIDVTSIINLQLAAGNKIITFALLNEGPESAKNDVQFSSREALTDKPQLNIIL